MEGDRGEIAHSELVFGEGLIMVGGTGPDPARKEAWRQFRISPRSVQGGNTQSLCLFVDDADAHCNRARAAGARIVREPRTDDYGGDYWADRTYAAADPEGHLWFFMQRVRTGGADAR